jgi:hypothetical protein
VRAILFCVILLLSGCSEASNSEPRQCVYNDDMIFSEVQKGGKVKKYSAKRYDAEQGDERVFREELIGVNGDRIVIEQSYCHMYNYTLTYLLLGDKKPTSLVESLPVLDDLIAKAKAHEALTLSFSEIVLESLSMSQKMLKEPFSLGLPPQFTSTTESVEYSFDYRPIENSEYGAEFKIYIGVGGL